MARKPMLLHQKKPKRKKHSRVAQQTLFYKNTQWMYTWQISPLAFFSFVAVLALY